MDTNTLVICAVRSSIGVVPVLALGAALASAQLPQVTKLNGPLPLGPIDGDVADFLIGPDGTRAVYRADQDTDEVDELYAVPTDGSGAPVKLSLPSPGSEVRLFRISPDGARVVFTLTGATPGVRVVPIDGSAPPLALDAQEVGDVQIGPDGLHAVFSTATGLYAAPLDGSSAAVQLATVAAPFRISPDGQHVLYQDGGSPLVDGLFELYTVPISGATAPIDLDGARFSESDYAFSPDGSRVFFRASRGTLYSAEVELYSAPVDGSRPARQESVELAEDRDVLAFRLDPTGRRVVYLADQRADERFELFSVALTQRWPRRAGTAGPGRSTRISGDLTSGGDVGPAFEISANGALVVYTADQAVDGVVELFAADIAGAGPYRLNAPLVADGDVDGFVLAPDGSRVVYRADQDTDGTVELYSVATDGLSGPVKLSGPMAAGRDVDDGVRISADGSRVAYLADEDTAGALDLYGAPITGDSPRVRLSAGTSTYRDVLSFRFAAASRAVYLQRGDFDSVQELHAVPADGSAPAVTLNGPLADDAIGRVYQFASSPDGQRAVYTADQDTATISELYSATASPGLQIVKLSQPLVAGGEVRSFLLAPDGTRVVFLADAETSGVLELYAVPADSSAAPVELSGPLVAGGTVQSYRIGSDGARVLYAADALTDEVAQLFSVPIDGSTAPVLLSGTLDLGPSEISPDASRVVFNGGVNVYSVPFDGSAPAVRVNEPALTGSHTASGFLISADSSRVVYTANPGALTVYNLYSAPLLGGGPAVRLNATLASNQHIYGYELAPTGTHVVYRTYRDDAAAESLHSAPLDGSAPSTKIHGPVDGIGDFDVTASGARVVFISYEAPSTPALMSVPVDGSASAVALAPGLLVLESHLAPSGDRVVFAAGEELYAVPDDGSQAPLLLSSALPNERSLGAFRISADGATVVYTSDALALQQFDLFSVPIDASQAPVRRNSPLVWLGDVATFQVLGDAHRIVYLADQEGDEVYELYRSDL